MTGSEWPGVLDGLEALVRAQETALAGRGPYPSLEGFPPEVDGPLPAELRVRALALLSRFRALEARAGTELARRRGRLLGRSA